MKIAVPSNFLSQLLFVLCVTIPYLNNFELTMLVWTGTVLISVSKNYSYSFLKLSIPFLVILVIATVVMFFHEYKTYYIIRDVAYLIKPVIGFFIGYQLCKRNLNNAFKLVITTGLIIAVLHLLILLFAVIVFRAATVNDLRFYGGYFSDYEVYVLIILIFHKKFELDLSPKRLRIITLIVGFSVFLYLARTNFLQFLILFLAIKGYFTLNKTSLTIITTIILVSIIGYVAVLYIDPKRNGEGVEAFLYKIKVAPLEPFKTKINRADYIDFNDNYRSYENIMTIRQVSRDGMWNVFFGKGLGSIIDLKQKVYLGDMELRFISILHNGFMIVFLKSGIVGILIYLYSIYYFFRKKKGDSNKIRQINLLFLGTGIFLILSNWVFLGFYNLIDTKTIFMGFLIAYSEKSRNNIQE
ncbi:hypothetical protein [Flavobacterium sp. GT3R68]|uniref:hypothetical protein n=1 Tax=Flavobacterium sp. GT3R68 TaxID=2594437 RepID=UPI000F896A08|nr:hypothetical protein [Flavobacterium sp. GT3R68]RTY95918.1 hypothetical protein EKL32_04530 [Flavobacterium sp. GSN2]TRW93690.1 hypothetical protein FNW07_01920 [Flavobacterium sp. GT3R68]